MSDDAATPDLTLIGTADLIAELFDRHDAILIVREVSDPADTSRDTFYDFGGGLSNAIGLASRATQRLLRYAADADVPREDNE